MLKTDASNTGLRAVLLQKDEETKKWASKKFTQTERRYRINEKKMVSVVWEMKRFEHELRRKKFKLVTSHKALIEFKNKPNF